MTHLTIADIAARLGISTAAVSYALNGRPGVSAATRQRVLDLVEEMEWKPDSTARSLRSRRSMAVGIALSRDPEEIAYDPSTPTSRRGSSRRWRHEATAS
ncbi:MAG: LacI family DNA-binding transcriptional regulator [Acidipropionibacterium acidipropionici]|jgi:DNA-binding LacI/PurR family transcriptional regulator|uniref:LacI family DNA-binding transcriptional regulator n=1 Tax=Acidipropionibacterium acidipropionici TaxID=1748 RepID=UPI002F354102